MTKFILSLGFVIFIIQIIIEIRSVDQFVEWVFNELQNV